MFFGKKLFCILIMIAIPGLFAFIKTHQTVHSNRVNFNNVNYISLNPTFKNGSRNTQFN